MGDFPARLDYQPNYRWFMYATGVVTQTTLSMLYEEKHSKPGSLLQLLELGIRSCHGWLPEGKWQLLLRSSWIFPFPDRESKTWGPRKWRLESQFFWFKELPRCLINLCGFMYLLFTLSTGIWDNKAFMAAFLVIFGTSLKFGLLGTTYCHPSTNQWKTTGKANVSIIQ